MTTQLRIYTVKPGAMESFVEEWTKGVLPLRRKHGFSVDGAWMMPEGNKFVWIVRYDGPEGFEAKEKAYYDSPERKAMSPNPARHLEKTETSFLEPVLPR